MSLQLSHIIILLVLLPASKIIDAIVVINNISLVKLEFVHHPILPFDVGQRELSQGLEIEADVMNVVVKLFFKLGEEDRQMLVFYLKDYLLYKGLSAWNGQLALFGLVVADSWLAVNPWIILRALLTLEIIFVRRKQALKSIALISRLSLRRDPTFIGTRHHIILLKVTLLGVKAKIILAVSDGAGSPNSIILCGDERLLHGRVGRKLKRIGTRVRRSRMHLTLRKEHGLLKRSLPRHLVDFELFIEGILLHVYYSTQGMMVNFIINALCF